MKFIVFIFAIYAYFSFALLDSLKGLSYRNLVTAAAPIIQKAESETGLIAHTTQSDNKRIMPFTVD